VTSRFGLDGKAGVRTWLAALLVLGIGVHLAQFRFIEVNSGDLTSAWVRSESSDLLSVGLPGTSNSWSRYSYAVALAELAPGSSLFEASDSQDGVRRRALGFGKAAEFHQLAVTTQELLGDFDPKPFVVATGEGGRRGAPWAIAIVPGDSSFGNPDDPESFLEEILENHARKEHEGGFARKFFVVTIDNPEATVDDKFDYELYFIETDLLGIEPEELLP